MTTSTITTTATRDLAATHREWGLPDDSAIRWLLEQGIADTTLTEPYPIGAARVLFHDGGTFDVDAAVQRALRLIAASRSILSPGSQEPAISLHGVVPPSASATSTSVLIRRHGSMVMAFACIEIRLIGCAPVATAL
jgi:hypothetical protein